MKTIFTLALLLVATGTWAQSLNLSFETWNSSGRPAPFDWEEPAEWTSTNAQTEWSQAGIHKSNHSYRGSYSMQLLNLNINSGWYSIACLGSPTGSTDPMNPDLDLITGGKPIDYRPVRLSGHYLHNGHTAARGKAVVILKKYNTATQQRDTIGFGQTFLPPSEHYTSFEVDINYLSNEQPDSVVIAFYSDDPGNPHAPPGWIHDGLLIDHLSLDQTTDVSEAIEAPQEEFTIYPNPSTGSFKIKFTEVIEEHPYRLMNYLNSLQFYGSIRGDELDLTGLKPGQYWLAVYVNEQWIHKPIQIIP